MTKDCQRTIGSKACPLKPPTVLHGDSCRKEFCALWDEISKVCCFLSFAIDFGIIRALMQMEKEERDQRATFRGDCEETVSPR